jgi:hypothetical protein
MNNRDLLGALVRATGLVLFVIAILQAFNLIGRILGIRVAAQMSIIGDLYGMGTFGFLGFVLIRNADKIASLAYNNGRPSKDI